MRRVVAVLLSFVSAPLLAQDRGGEAYFVRAEAEIDGKPFKIACERQGMAASREMSDNFFPSPGNKYRSYQVACSKNGMFAGASVKFASTLDVTKETLPPYDGTATWESLDKTFTVRVADAGGKELQIHSFMNSEERNVRQHYTGTPKAVITELTEVKEGEKTFHVIAGTVEASFDEKVIQGKKKGAKGKVTLAFRTKVRYVSDIGKK